MLKQVLLAAALILPLPGCATYDVAEQVSGEVTGRSIDWICNRISLREWRETFARSGEMMRGWNAMCSSIPSIPITSPAPPPTFNIPRPNPNPERPS